MPAAFSKPKKVSKRGVVGDGRPTKLTPAVIAKLKEAFSYGLNDDQAAALVGVSDMTLTTWKRDPAFMHEIREAINERLLVRLKRIETGDNGWQGLRGSAVSDVVFFGKFDAMSRATTERLAA
jgi:hypothetical protein